MKRLFPEIAALLGILAIAGCGGRKSAPTPRAATVTEEAELQRGPRWVFLPREKEPTVDEVQFAGGVVEVDGAGSRWWRAPGKEPQVSAFGAPEPLSAVLESGERLAVVGQSGTVYFSKNALSPFDEIRTPPEQFVMTRRSGSTVVAVSEDGSIHRSENFGRSWERVDSDRFFVEIGASGDGTILAYSVPEQWYKSTDSGRTFEREALATQAPRALDKVPTGELLVEGLYQTSVYRRGKFERVEDEFLRKVARDRRGQQYTLPKFASASPVAAGRAVVFDEAFVLLRPSVEGKPWTMTRGTLDGPLQDQAVEGLDGCGEFRFTATRGRAAVICQGDLQEVTPRLKIYRRSGSTGKFRPVQKLFRGQLPHLRLSLSRSGELAVTELCSEPEKGCQPMGVTRIVPKGDVTETFVPGVQRPSALAFDSAGRLWVAGFRDKDGHLVAYLAGDSEETGRLIDLTREAGFPASVSETTPPTVHVLPDEEGEVSVMAVLTGRAHVALFDTRANIIAFGATPSGASVAHGAGRRVAAIEEEEGVLWESLTGGLSWYKSPLPRALCTGPASQCQPKLACSAAGCLVGDELARVGWGEAEGVPPALLPTDVGTEPQMTELSGFECQVGESDWSELPGLIEVPGAENAALGSSAWASALQFPESASLTAISARFGEPELEREVLLAPVPDAGSFAFYVSPQVEGVAAVRYRVPQVTAGSTSWSGVPSVRAEVVWDNRIFDVYGSAVIESNPAMTGGLLGFGMFRPGQPDMMSVAGRGLYFRLGPPSSDSVTYFVQGRGKLAQFEMLEDVNYPSGTDARGGWVNDPEVRGTGRAEFLRIDGRHAGLLSLANRRVMTLALGLEAKGKEPSFHPYLSGVPRGDSTGLAQAVRYAYLGNDLGFVSFQIDLEGTGHRAAFLPLDPEAGFADPISVPLQQDLDDEITPCSAEQRKATPRVVAPPVLGATRAARIHGVASRVIELQVDGGVLHGTPEKPCVAAFDTRQDGRLKLRGEFYSALILPAGISWVFRSERRTGGMSTIFVRPMTCRQEGATP